MLLMPMSCMGNCISDRRQTILPGTLLDVYEWDTNKFLGRIPQLSHTYSVVGNMNEHQVAIGETTYGGRSELMDSTGIIDYGSLIYITLQRARTAREAIKIMGELVAEYGYASSGESFSIADPNEVWIMELIGKGNEMVTKKGKTYQQTQRSRLGGCQDSRWLRVGPCQPGQDPAISAERSGKLSLRTRRNLLCPRERLLLKEVMRSSVFLIPMHPSASEEPGSATCVSGPSLRTSMMRWTSTFDYVKGEDLENRMPLYIKPKRKISNKDLMNFMRDHLEGTELDMTKDAGAGPFGLPYRWRPLTWEYDGKMYVNERATATQQTGFSFVAESRPMKPDWLGRNPLVWN